MLRWFSLILLFPLGFAQLPPCGYSDLLTVHQDYSDWQLSLLDTHYALPESYQPQDLVSADEANLSSDYQIRSIMVADLKALAEAANEAGFPLEIQSAYRSYTYQARTFDYWVNQEGYEAALKSSARAGHSEHQLGTAVDFRSAGGPAPWTLEDWGATPTGYWLKTHAHLYGFVMSYPKGKTALTCYIYEPWHYRYLGKEAAMALKESGLSLREWLWQQQ